MGILDKIGMGSTKSADEVSKKAAAVKPKKESKKEAKSEVVKKAPSKPTKAGDKGRAYLNLVRPIISEKATMLSTDGKYVFVVSKKSNKSEIKKSIEAVYGVNVTQVNVINLSGKLRRQGRSFGKTSDWKKAVITLKKGEKIPGIIEAAQ